MTEDLRKSIRLIKASKGWTYKSIAHQIGVSPSTIYNWLGYQHNLSLKTKQRIKKFIKQIKEENE